MAGNERLAYEIAAIYSGSPEVKKAFDDFAKLNVQGQRVVNQLDKMGSAAKNTGEQIRNSRQGAAQLGMQFNQLGTQVAGGTSLFTAFAQQIGDVGYSMSFMEGKLGSVGRFLAGPWGAALGIAAVALGPLISNMFGVGDAADEMKSAQERSADAAKALQSSTERLQSATEAYQLATAKSVKDQLDLQNGYRETARQALLSATQQVVAAIAVTRSKISALGATRKYNDELLRGAILSGDEAAVAGTLFDTNRRESNSLDNLTDSVSSLNEMRSSLNDSLAEYLNRSTAVVRTQDKIANASRPKGGRDKKDGETAAEKFSKAYEKSLKAKMDDMKADGGSIFGRNIDYFMGGSIVEGMTSVFDQVNEMSQQMYPDMVRAITGPNEEMIKSFEAIGQSVDGAFKNMLTAGGSWRDGMRSIIQSVIDQLWKMYVTQQIVGMISGGINSLLGLPQVPGKALGGAVNANQMYMVGEKGPELFMPGASGTIIPNNKVASAGSGSGSNINISVDARGSADPAAVRAQVQQGILEAAPAIIAAAQQRTVSGLRRPRLGGVMQ